MKFLSKLAAIAIIASTYASAFVIKGTVDSITQEVDGSIKVNLIRASDSVLIVNKYILSDDIYKQEKMAILLTGKTSGREVGIDVTGSTIGSVTLW